MSEHLYTKNEDLLNALTHGIGFLLSFIGLYLLVVQAQIYGGAMEVTSASIYGASLMTLYAASTIYHSSSGERRVAYQIYDHACIYILIAGTYTPLTLITLQGAWGWSLFGIIWGLAVMGMTFKVFGKSRFSSISTLTYLLMGWLVLIAIQPILDNIEYGGFMLILAGGLAYSTGVIFYVLDHIRYMHTIFHLFVLLGSALHYAAIYYYVIPTID